MAANPEATFVDRLQAAYAKELAARDYYLAAAAAFPRPRRFANLARAEQRHAEAIAVAIEGLGAKPAPREPVRIDAPRSVVQADAAGRRIEVEVIALYKDLLRDCKDPGVRTILDHIQAANLRHLEAFGG